jgi:hypothetical protein
MVQSKERGFDFGRQGDASCVEPEATMTALPQRHEFAPAKPTFYPEIAPFSLSFSTSFGLCASSPIVKKMLKINELRG